MEFTREDEMTDRLAIELLLETLTRMYSKPTMGFLYRYISA